MTEDAVMRMDNATKYYLQISKKNYPSVVGENEYVPFQFEVSKLSIEDSNGRGKDFPIDETAETQLVTTRNQSVDDSCLYAKAKLNESRKKKALNKTMNCSRKKAYNQWSSWPNVTITYFIL